MSGLLFAAEDLPTALTAQMIEVNAADVGRPVNMAAMGAGLSRYSGSGSIGGA